ncbi:MAG: hydroxymethylbilane synthase [Gammaproteobacteria bacterium]|nr:hydroxymethylbilane synthase [Gammaproteobacteria bacterium]
MSVLRIATRKSPLALRQAELVASELRRRHPDLEVTLLPLSTRGDKLLDAPLATVGGKGLFIKELESALLDGRADVAVHSVKDVTVEIPAGLQMPVICRRADPRDALVSRQYSSLDALPEAVVVGTSSLRRRCQLLALRPDLRVVNLRGGVNTRLRKLDAGDFDAVILACAGLARLGLEDRIAEAIPPERMIPAIGQGALGLEIRAEDTTTGDLIAPLNDAASAVCVRAERAMNAALVGGCQVPLAGHAVLDGEQLALVGLVASVDGGEVVRVSQTAPAADPESLGRAVAGALLDRGAGKILAKVYDSA